MSARTPFFPQGSAAGGGDRPPTRNTNRPSERSEPAANTCDGAPKLNTSGLSGLKKKNRGTLSGNAGGFNGGGGLTVQQIGASSNTRPGTADPHAHSRQGNGPGTPLQPRHSDGSLKAPPLPAFGTSTNGNGAVRTSSNPFGNKNAFARRDSSGPNIMAPIPIAANTPILDGIGSFDATPSFSGFKTPAIPGQSTANEAHIPRGNDEQQAQAQFRSPFTSVLHSASGDTSGNTTGTYVDDIDDHDDSFGAGTGNGKKDTSGILSGLDSGPRRVIIDSTGKAIGGTGAQYAERGQHEFVLPGHGINEHGRVFQQGGGAGDEGTVGMGGARQQLAGRKRNREQVDTSIQGSPYGMPEAKRMKTGKGPGSARGASAEQDNFVPRIQHSQHSRGHSRNGYESGASQEVGGCEQAQSSALAKVMKIDADEFIQQHLDLYDQNVQRWNACSLKEWMAGSDEIAAKFVEMLDLVWFISSWLTCLTDRRISPFTSIVLSQAKKAMSEQLKFYASLETKLSNYGEVLDDRKQSLEIARQKVLEESGNVLK